MREGLLLGWRPPGTRRRSKRCAHETKYFANKSVCNY